MHERKVAVQPHQRRESGGEGECGFPRVESNRDEQRDECESDDRVAIDEKLDRLCCDLTHERMRSSTRRLYRR